MTRHVQEFLFLLSFSVVAIGTPAVVKQPERPAISQETKISVTWAAKIPMRDGVSLNATIYRPHNLSERLPVIFTMTPYSSDEYHSRGMYFAENGYVFTTVDCRGRGNSEGEFVPFVNEARDGYDVVEWLARQTWSNGKIGMWGGSYSGYNQWVTAGQFPPHLATIVPAASAYPGKNIPMVNNIHNQYWIQWFALVAGRTLNHYVSEDRTLWDQRFRELYFNHLPFEDLERLAEISAPVFQEWLRHPSLDDYWRRMGLDRDQYRRLRIPILTITGEYDAAQPGALAFYFEHLRDGDPATTARHFVVIGPWDHGGTRTAHKEIGGWTFGEPSLVDLNHLNKEWYDWTLKNGAKPEFLKDRVAYYVGGAEEWKYADGLAQNTNQIRSFYLHRRSTDQVGVLNEQSPTTEQPDRYTYDPLDTRLGQLEHQGTNFGWWPNHYLSLTGPRRLPVAIPGTGLVYETSPFTDDMEVIGFPKFSAWMTIDTPDTDFQVMLDEIFPDGRMLVLTVDYIRARYRKSLEHEKLVKPGDIGQYQFSSFRFVARRIAKGNRLRLVITSPNSIFAEKNYNAGGIVTHESGKDARTAHVTLYHDAIHPTRLDLPLPK
jgi:uncharacterized protein